ncbi:DUF3011 domain-containing protein [Lysobacter sp. 2RAB21]
MGLVIGLGLSAGAVQAAPQYDDYGNGGNVIRCESDSGRYRTCPIDGNRARLQRQLSSTSCIEGQSWGSRQGEVWVNKGCRGEFVAGRGGGGDGAAVADIGRRHGEGDLVDSGVGGEVRAGAHAQEQDLRNRDLEVQAGAGGNRRAGAGGELRFGLGDQGQAGQQRNGQ